MTGYDLNQLDGVKFEQLVQALLKKIIGEGTISFGMGPDGGREATYEGCAPYPSDSNQWSGKWIFQAKFHCTRKNETVARRKIITDLDDELRINYKIARS